MRRRRLSPGCSWPRGPRRGTNPAVGPVGATRSQVPCESGNITLVPFLYPPLSLWLSPFRIFNENAKKAVTRTWIKFSATGHRMTVEEALEGVIRDSSARELEMRKSRRNGLIGDGHSWRITTRNSTDRTKRRRDA